MGSLLTIWAAGDVSREASTPISVAASLVIQVTYFCRACEERWQKKLLQQKRKQNALDFCSSHWLCPHNNCVTAPANHFGQSSDILSVCWAPALEKAASLGLSFSVPDHWQVVSAQSLLITFEDLFSSRSNCISGMCKVLAVSLYTDNDYWIWRKAAKKQKKRKKTEGLSTKWDLWSFPPFSLYSISFHCLVSPAVCYCVQN